MNRNYVRPVGLKGNDKLDRMKSLMGIAPVNENTIDRSETLLTKKGPDGKSYAIVRENQEYFIKTTDKQTNIVSEDFQYIGGLANKREKVFPSYAKALKNLNLSFISLAESTGNVNTINAFRNDNLVTEGYDDEPYYDDVKGKNDNRWDKDDAEENENDDAEDLDESEGTTGIVRGAGHDKHIMEIDEELTDTEKAIEEMISNGDEDETVNENFIQNTRLKIGRAMDIVDEGETRNQQFKTLIESLSTSEATALIESLKKKV